MRTPDEIARDARTAGALLAIVLALVSAFLGGRACGLDEAERPILAPAFR